MTSASGMQDLLGGSDADRNRTFEGTAYNRNSYLIKKERESRLNKFFTHPYAKMSRAIVL